MPLLPNSTYKAVSIFKNGHLNTVYAAVFRRIGAIAYQRERLLTPDRDFLDLDWALVGRKSGRLLIALHGLEGSAQRPYIRGIARYFNQNGWDVLALNFRGCSGALNLQLRSYHMGETSDLDFVIKTVLEKDQYQHIGLVGFSLGGNVVLKYMGERGAGIAPAIKAAVAFSVPCEMASANEVFNKWYNHLYLKRFMRSLNVKLQKKALLFPDKLDASKPLPRNFDEFDERYTAPAHGFQSAQEYWQKASSLPFLSGIQVPTLLVNPADDSFLSKSCYPIQEAERSEAFYLEIPKWGGHCGFVTFDKNDVYWTERRALDFIIKALQRY